MEINIYKRNTNGEKKIYHTIYFEPEESIYKNERVMFAHWIWKQIMKQKFGHEFTYVRDYADYDMWYNRLSYAGEGLYYEGKKILGVEDLTDGITDIEIKDNLYFILK